MAGHTRRGRSGAVGSWLGEREAGVSSLTAGRRRQYSIIVAAPAGGFYPGWTPETSFDGPDEITSAEDGRTGKEKVIGTAGDAVALLGLGAADSLSTAGQVDYSFHSATDDCASGASLSQHPRPREVPQSVSPTLATSHFLKSSNMGNTLSNPKKHLATLSLK